MAQRTTWSLVILCACALLLPAGVLLSTVSAEAPTTLSHVDTSAEGTFPVFHLSSVSFTHLKVSYSVTTSSFVDGIGGRYTSSVEFDAALSLSESGSTDSVSYVVTFPSNPTGGSVMLDLPGPHFLVTDGDFDVVIQPVQGEGEQLPLEQDSDNSGHTEFEADGATTWSPLDAEVALFARVEPIAAVSVGAAALSGTLSPADPIDLFALTLPQGSPLVVDVTNPDSADLQVRLSLKDTTTGTDVTSQSGSGPTVSLFTRVGAADRPSFLRIDSATVQGVAHYTVRVRVNGAPVAVGGGDRSGTVEVPMVLDASASSDPDGDLLNFTWSFGGTEHLPVLYGPQVTITPALPGALSVHIDVTDGFELATTAFTVTVHPKADISITVTPLGGFDSATVGQPVEFASRWSSEFQGDAANATYDWDFGDGTRGSGQAPSHTYDALPSSGAPKVAISLTAEFEGQSASDSKELRLNLPPEVALTRSGTGAARVGDQVGFNATATDSDSIVVARFLWNFGDGSLTSTTTVGRTSHAYSAPGNYTVLVTAQDSDGGNDNASVPLEVIARTTDGGHDNGDGPVVPGGSSMVLFIVIGAAAAGAVVVFLVLRARKSAIPPSPPPSSGEVPPHQQPHQQAPPPPMTTAYAMQPPQGAYPPAPPPVAQPQPAYAPAAPPPLPPQATVLPPTAPPLAAIPPLPAQVDHGRQLRSRQQALLAAVASGARIDATQVQRLDQLLSGAGTALAAGNLAQSAQLLQQAENAAYQLERTATTR